MYSFQTPNSLKCILIHQCAPFTDLGAIATDNFDLDVIVTAKVVTTNVPVDTSFVGVQKILYDVEGMKLFLTFEFVQSLYDSMDIAINFRGRVDQSNFQ